jgi:putative ATPase
MKSGTENIFERSLHSSERRPLAERCRPQQLDEVIGHEQIIGANRPLIRQIQAGFLPSLIIWGPPGVGKTTLARLLAKEAGYRFVAISAVSSGVKEVKEIIAESAQQLLYYQKPTVLFIDEIHRFSKAQQDALLHAAEDGTLVLIGATTENPSFEVIAPLLSRSQVIRLEALQSDDLEKILRRAAQTDLLLKEYEIDLDGMGELIHFGSGDARRALNLMEIAFHLAEKDGRRAQITADAVRQAASQNSLYYDKKGDWHYDVISAFIKSVRGSDPDAAVYWLACMLEAGEDPLFIARRLIVLASEDIGNAEPYALSLANAAFEAVHNIGMPEARIILAQATTYLASCPKSNAAYLAVEAARDAVKSMQQQAVPLHLRNAPTRLMQDMQYGAEYKYPHDFPNHFTEQSYLPPALENSIFYRPTGQGREANLKAYLTRNWPKHREKKP